MDEHLERLIKAAYGARILAEQDPSNYQTQQNKDQLTEQVQKLDQTLDQLNDTVKNPNPGSAPMMNADPNQVQKLQQTSEQLQSQIQGLQQQASTQTLKRLFERSRIFGTKQGSKLVSARIDPVWLPDMRISPRRLEACLNRSLANYPVILKVEAKHLLLLEKVAVEENGGGVWVSPSLISVLA